MTLSHADLAPLVAAVRRAIALCAMLQQEALLAADKPGREPVTVADYAVQALLNHTLRAVFPRDAVLAEERAGQFTQVSAALQARATALAAHAEPSLAQAAAFAAALEHGRDVASARVWAVDPIDGTSGFLARRGYTIALGLLEDGVPVASVMGCPAYPNPDGAPGRVFVAAGGQALWGGVDPDDAFPSRPARVADADAPLVVAQSVERRHADHHTLAQVYAAYSGPATTPDVRPVDGQDKYAMVASGDALAYVRLSPDADYRERAWDHAAGAALVAAAGGTVTDLHGAPLDFSAGPTLTRNQCVLVTHGAHHTRWVAALQHARAAHGEA